MFLDNGQMSPLLTVTCIPIYLLVVKPFFSRWLPNLFKRMGLSIAIVVVFFVCAPLISDTFAYDSNTKINQLHSICKATGKNSSYVLNWNLIKYIYVYTPTYSVFTPPNAALYCSLGVYFHSKSTTPESHLIIIFLRHLQIIEVLILI